MMPEFASSRDQKQIAHDHLIAAASGITAARADGTLPAPAADALAHLHDAVVALAKIDGVYFEES
jgi:hypothetical protein